MYLHSSQCITFLAVLLSQLTDGEICQKSSKLILIAIFKGVIFVDEHDIEQSLVSQASLHQLATPPSQ